ncbi:MAG TPA: PEP-utilizing enzyme [Acidimicrobiales bacterium]|nr:PEP-utilizing enzyme [Acidimicrobiales bacterium]
MTDAKFEAPGAGMWNLDRSHFPGGTTPLSQWFMEGAAKGARASFKEIGMPADTLDIRFVNGFMYTRLRPLISPERATTKLPPVPVLKLAVRIHPEMRRRAKQAARAIEARPWLRVIDDWQRTIRPRLEATNEELDSVDLAALDDDGLAAHVERLLQYIRENFELHFYLHTFDLGPIGFLLADCERWGLSPADVIPALSGASPATSAPARILSQLRALIASSATHPETLDDVRAISPEASALLDEYFQRRGRMMVTRYDLDGRTLEEQPEIVRRALLSSTEGIADEERANALAAQLRERVPAADRARFDQRLAEARGTMDLRDDNGPNTVELPVGLLRHALLEAGRRASATGRLTDASLVFELQPEEVSPFVREHAGPSDDELAARAADRHAAAQLTPPNVLGPTEVTPPLEVLAPAHQTFIAAVQAVIAHMGMVAADGAPKQRMEGAGVGTESYRGTARVATSPEDALDSMAPGDVLVVRFTTPAYNTVLTIAGAVVTTEGALLSHAAVMARELGIPAVIGAQGALDEIPDGAEVEVDPVAGTVKVLVAP